ncbi:MAG: hypothetical protein WCJ30_14725 [Deltaproteobacteria bacterium]
MTDAPRSVPVDAHAAAHLSSRSRGLAAVVRHPYSLAAVLALLVARPGVIAATNVIADPDLWWVAAAGRIMRATGHVPDANMFSFSEPHHPWVMHEWLFARPYAALLERAGAPAFSLVAALACVATLAPVLAVASRARHAITALLVVFLATTVFELRMITPRPPHVALVFATALAALAFRETFTRRHVIVAGALGLLWTNAHGRFPLGLALLASGAMSGLPGRRERAVGAAAFALATLCNPYGLRLHALVLSYMLGSEGSMSVVHGHVTEFAWLGRALARGYLDPVRLTGLVAVTSLAAWAVTRREFRSRGLAALVPCAMTVGQLRHLELAGLVGVIVLAPAMDALLDRQRTLVTVDAAALSRTARWILAGALVAAVIAHAAVRSVRPPQGWVTDDLGGENLPALIAALPPHTRLHTSFVQTGVAIWYGAPRDVRVLYDLRNDCYGRETALDAVVLEKAPPGSAEALAVLTRRGVEAVIVRATHSLAATLRGAAGWRESARRGGLVTYTPRAGGDVPLSGRR